MESLFPHKRLERLNASEEFSSAEVLYDKLLEHDPNLQPERWPEHTGNNIDMLFYEVFKGTTRLHRAESGWRRERSILLLQFGHKSAYTNREEFRLVPYQLDDKQRLIKTSATNAGIQIPLEVARWSETSEDALGRAFAHTRGENGFTSDKNGYTFPGKNIFIPKNNGKMVNSDPFPGIADDVVHRRLSFDVSKDLFHRTKHGLGLITDIEHKNALYQNQHFILWWENSNN